MDQSTEEIVLPSELVSQVRLRIDDTQFESPDEYIAFIVEEVLHYAGEPISDEQSIDEDMVKDRLKSLGYIEE